MSLDVRGQFLGGFVLDATNATFEVLSVLMSAQMPMNKEARREVFTAYLAAENTVYYDLF